MKRLLKTIKTWFTPNRKSASEPFVKQPTKPVTMADLCARIKVMTMSDEHRQDLDEEYLAWKEHHNVIEELTQDINKSYKLS